MFVIKENVGKLCLCTLGSNLKEKTINNNIIKLP